MPNSQWYLITGASSGIGLSLAEYLAAQGFNLILLSKNQKNLLDAKEKLLAKTKVDILLCPFNLANAQADDYLELKRQLSQSISQLDGLVHCAGIINQLTPLENMSMLQWQQTIQVNLNARFLLTKHCLDLLRKASKAQLLFIQSELTVLKGQANWGAYQVTETATKTLVEILQHELSHTKITIDSILLPPIATKLRKKIYPFEDETKRLSLDELSQRWPTIFNPSTPLANGREGQSSKVAF